MTEQRIVVEGDVVIPAPGAASRALQVDTSNGPYLYWPSGLLAEFDGQRVRLTIEATDPKP